MGAKYSYISERKALKISSFWYGNISNDVALVTIVNLVRKDWKSIECIKEGWLCIVGHNYNYISVVVVFFFKICSAILNVIPALSFMYT